MLLLGERRHGLKAAISVASTFALVGIAIALLVTSDAASDGSTSAIGVYRLGDWPAPFGIVLVLDRLSALMLLLTSILASAAVVFSLARWHRAGAHFHSLFQFLLMGLNGAFLTGDLFNLFVFFELLLAASYGLALHGSGAARVKAGLHYIVVNLAASLLFSDRRQPDLRRFRNAQHGGSRRADPGHRRGEPGLLEAGAGILGIAFLLKAGMWPLCFWLPTTYAAASPPVASIFAIMTKVGAYIVLRLWLLLFGEGSRSVGGVRRRVAAVRRDGHGRVRRHRDAGVAGHGPACRIFRARVLRNGARRDRDGTGRRHRRERSSIWSARRSASARFSCWSSSSSEVANREPTCSPSPAEAYGEDDDSRSRKRTRPASRSRPPWAMLGIGLHRMRVDHRRAAAAVRVHRQVRAPDRRAQPIRDGPGRRSVPAASWALLVALILSGLAALIAMTRAGIRAFWAAPDRAMPRVAVIEMAPIAALLILCAAADGPGRAGHALHAGNGPLAACAGDYVRAVLPPAEQQARKAGGK